MAFPPFPPDPGVLVHTAGQISRATEKDAMRISLSIANELMILLFFDREVLVPLSFYLCTRKVELDFDW